MSHIAKRLIVGALVGALLFTGMQSWNWFPLLFSNNTGPLGGSKEFAHQMILGSLITGLLTGGLVAMITSKYGIAMIFGVSLGFLSIYLHIDVFTPGSVRIVEFVVISLVSVMVANKATGITKNAGGQKTAN